MSRFTAGRFELKSGTRTNPPHHVGLSKLPSSASSLTLEPWRSEVGCTAVLGCKALLAASSSLMLPFAASTPMATRLARRFWNGRKPAGATGHLVGKRTRGGMVFLAPQRPTSCRSLHTWVRLDTTDRSRSDAHFRSLITPSEWCVLSLLVRSPISTHPFGVSRPRITRVRRLSQAQPALSCLARGWRPSAATTALGLP